MKGVPKEEIAQRPDQVKALAAKIDAVPDGVTINNRRAQKGPGSIREIKIDAINPGKDKPCPVADGACKYAVPPDSFEPRFSRFSR